MEGTIVCVYKTILRTDGTIVEASKTILKTVRTTLRTVRTIVQKYLTKSGDTDFSSKWVKTIVGTDRTIVEVRYNHSSTK